MLGGPHSERCRFLLSSEHTYVAPSGLYLYMGYEIGLRTSTDRVKIVEPLTGINGAQKNFICFLAF
jgi:hypothetical protein